VAFANPRKLRAGARSGLARALLLTLAAASPAGAVDLVVHNGFEECWAKSISKTQFTDLMQSAIDGATTCIASSSGGCGTGCSYTACNTPACPGSAVGCPVTTHANTFSGTFAAGASGFSASGSADNISVPVSYVLFGNPGSCTVTVANISLSYSLDYTLSADGNNGLYAGSLDQTLVTVNNGYTATSPDITCNIFANTFAQSIVPTAETAAAAAVESLELPATVGESVCPLTP